MGKTLTIVMTSGMQENEDPIFMVGLAEAMLRAGHKVNIFLYGNSVNMANREKALEGRVRISEHLLQHTLLGKVGEKLGNLVKMGAQIATCHTNEYGRGTEADEYREGVQWGDAGESLTRFLVTTDVLLVISH